MTYFFFNVTATTEKIKGLSEKILVSHYENNYTGAVKRLNAIVEQIASLDYAKAPGFLINGLKREELIATNSMILHEAYFAGLGDESQPGVALTEALARDFGSLDRWHAEFVAMGKAEGGGSGGGCARSVTVSSRCWCRSICWSWASARWKLARSSPAP